MTIDILLALAASVFTAAASVAQRLAAAPAPGELSFSWRLVTFLLHRPVWFLGILFMIAGFGFQLVALDSGDLALVQSIIATELLFVFVFLALRRRHLVKRGEWVMAAGMAVGLGSFLFLANPRGGSIAEATTGSWLLAGGAVAAASLVAISAAVIRHKGEGRIPSPARKAALLGVAAATVWGFVDAVIKVLADHIQAGPAAVFSNWSPYVLLGVGALAMFLASNAFHAGPLAASQPAFTIVDPLVASLLGVVLFGEHIDHAAWHLVGETAALIVLVVSVVFLSHSPLVGEQVASAPAPTPASAPAPSAEDVVPHADMMIRRQPRVRRIPLHVRLTGRRVVGKGIPKMSSTRRVRLGGGLGGGSGGGPGGRRRSRSR